MSGIERTRIPVWPEGLLTSGETTVLKAKASLLDGIGQRCPAYVAQQMRPGVWPEVEGWRANKPSMLGFFLGRIYDAIVAIEDGADPDQAIDSVLAEEKKNEPAVHPLVAAYARHAVDTYVELSSKRAGELDLKPALDRKIEVIKRGEPIREVTAWGTWYETDDSLYREFRRLRMGAARVPNEESLRYAACAAKLLVDGSSDVGGPKHVPDRVGVFEVGLVDGSITTIWEGTFEEARQFYDEQCRPAIAEALEAPLELRPGWDCGSCGWRAGCPAIPHVRGLLGLPKIAVTSRQISASALDDYKRCPSRYVGRAGFLPATGDHSSTPGQLRGLSVHMWLEAAHARGIACSETDFPEPAGRDADPLGILDDDEYEAAWPFLRAHLPVCPFLNADIDDVEAEPRVRVWDSDADVLVVAGPDIRWRVNDIPVWRETKTVVGLPPRDELEALQRWPQIALNLAMLAGGTDGGTGHRPDVALARLEIECLTTSGASMLALDTDNDWIVSQARRIVAELAYEWSQDTEFKATAGPYCQNCKSFRWCEESVVPAASTTAEIDDDFVSTEEPPW